MKKILRRIISSLLNQCEYDNYDIDKLQNSQSNSKANFNEIKDLNIS